MAEYTPEQLDELADAIAAGERFTGPEAAAAIRAYAATLRQAARVDEVCEGCSGHGEVGGLTPHGYESHECPFCHGTGKEAALSAQPAPVGPLMGDGTTARNGDAARSVAPEKAQPAERQGEASEDAIRRAQDVYEAACDEPASYIGIEAVLNAHHAAPVGVPDGWKDESRAFLAYRLNQMADGGPLAFCADTLRDAASHLAAAPSAPQEEG